MNAPLIWIHVEALRATHPNLMAAAAGIKAIHVWDDHYFRQANYSLKRLVFIYETLCELPIDIIYGNTLEVVRELAPSLLYVPATHNPLLLSLIDSLKSVVSVRLVEDEVFASIKNPVTSKRFFQYWNQAKKTAFYHHQSPPNADA